MLFIFWISTRSLSSLLISMVIINYRLSVPRVIVKVSSNDEIQLRKGWGWLMSAVGSVILDSVRGTRSQTEGCIHAMTFWATGCGGARLEIIWPSQSCIWEERCCWLCWKCDDLAEGKVRVVVESEESAAFLRVDPDSLPVFAWSSPFTELSRFLTPAVCKPSCFTSLKGEKVGTGTLVAVWTRGEIHFDAKVGIGFLKRSKVRAGGERRCK